MSPTCRRSRSATLCSFGARRCQWKNWRAPPAPLPTNYCAGSASGCRSNQAEPKSALALEKSHLHASQLDDIIVGQPPRLGTDWHAVDEREVIFLLAIDMDNEVAAGPSRDGRHLYARTSERGQGLGQFQLAAGKGARQHLQLGLLQRRAASQGATGTAAFG